MTRRAFKWTQDLRKIMYARIVMEFGSYDDWNKSSYPDGHRERYDAVLKELAEYFKLLTGEDFEATAVEQQVKWGYTKQESVLQATHVRPFILNKAAALEMGFIKAADLPSELLPSNE